ncbi:MAG: adenylate kinase [Hyphomicrobiales bacterium]
MLNIALFGPPGAGKGTQSKLLLKEYNLTYISTGDILREEIAAGTDLGFQAKEIIEKGGLAPDEIIVQIIEKKIKMNPDSNGILFDGFPRTIVQAYILEGLLLKLNTSLTCMLSLEVPKDELVTRLLDRAKVSNRKDDTHDVIQYRLREYENKTAPVADFYREKGMYFPIQGVGTVKEIFGTIKHTIEQSLQKVWFNVVLLGFPGAGKGTQGKMLAEKYNLVYISTGKMLRKEVTNDTEIGRIAKPYMEKGEIVPDEIAIKLIERKIKKNSSAKGFIFKGFPRTIVQAYILDGLLRRMNSRVSVMLDMKVPVLESVKRLAERGNTGNARIYDGSTELIVKRLEQYENKTFPVIDYYKKQNKYVGINGHGDETQILNRLSESVEEAFSKIR